MDRILSGPRRIGRTAAGVLAVPGQIPCAGPTRLGYHWAVTFSAPDRPRAPARLRPGPLAVAAGLAVANVFLLHAVLPVIAADLGVPERTAALVVTAGAAGYAVGLGLVLPLGDVRDRRRLVVVLLALVAAGQLVAATAPTMGVLLGAVTLLSAAGVVAPLLVAHAGSLAEPAHRGRVTGVVLTGVLLGVLLARTGGALITGWTGTWRSACIVAAVVALVLGAWLWRTLPPAPVPVTDRGYRAVLASVPRLVAEEPVLRSRCLVGMFSFASFAVLWTSVAFHLSGPPFGWSSIAIGAVGLLGAAAAWWARRVGPLVDRGLADRSTAVLLGAMLAGWVAAFTGSWWVVPLLAGVVLVDGALQGVQVVNMASCLRTRPDAASRVTTAYMLCYFSGGIVGSLVSAMAYRAGGWPAVCAVGAACCGAALLCALRRPVGTPTRSGAPATGPAS